MINCKTVLDKRTLYDAAEYYCQANKHIKRKNIIIGILSIIGTVYYFSKLIYFLLHYRSIFYLESLMYLALLLLTIFCIYYIKYGQKVQMCHDLTREFYPNDIYRYTILNYTFSGDNIMIENDGNVSLIVWDSVENFSVDKKYYHFSIQGQYYIISKSGFTNQGVHEFNFLLKQKGFIGGIRHDRM